MTAAWIEIANHHLQRFTTRLQQLGVKTNNFRHSADTNAVIETGNGDFVGFIKNSGYRRTIFLRNWNGQRVAFQRIHRNINNAFEHRRRVRTKRHHIRIGLNHFITTLHAVDLLAVAKQLVNGRIKAEFNPRLLRHPRQILGKQLAVSGFIIGQLQAARQFVRYFCQRGLHFRQAAGFQQLIRYASIFQHGDIAGRVFILLFGTEQLQRPTLTPFILNIGFGAQCFQAITAVFRQTYHPPFVFHVVAGVAVT